MPAHKKTQKLSAEEIRNRLKLKHLDVVEKLHQKHPHVRKFFQGKGIDLGKIREHSAKLISAGALTGALLLSSPENTKLLPSPQEIIEKLNSNDIKDLIKGKKNQDALVANTLKSILPKRPRPLTRNEEKFLEAIFQNTLNVPARATLEGEHLNTTYGYIGAEQHLRRYPGDKLAYHGDKEIIKSGMAPGLSAWGYLADSKNELNQYHEDMERWYAVVQTMYLPDWNKRHSYLKNWYKYRKVLIVNSENGTAVVAAIADSGPAAWTGKHFGASPEVMEYLGGPTYKKGPVIVFFVDDPENKVPLGPVEYNI